MTASEKRIDRTMYVCTTCSDVSPETCGYWDRQDLALMPDGRWLCERCFEAEASPEQQMSQMPCPPEYAPLHNGERR